MDKNLTGAEIREKFLRYFESKGHTRVASSSLVPYNDPTLLFTNAGMNQFKNTFLGLEKRDYTRATSAQKCVRAGGKHNDLDTVGRTARHHTFFEMLGNFSFGDYFKEDAIRFAWEFLTVEMGLDPNRLWITIYKDDDEAFELWQKLTPVPAERIVRLGEKDNFWQMGDTGPCGPCSEIHYDRGEKYACGPNCGIGKCDCDRYLEIWNLVFMQYNRSADGTMTPLPKPSIDTGMGLERITSIVQECESNYETDIMRNIMAEVEKVVDKPYYKDMRGFPIRVIADHIRSCTFLISDGVLPSNEGRGYVLRRILRRAIRFGKSLGVNEPFMYKLVDIVVKEMGAAYPDIVKNQESVKRTIKAEEERFGITLDAGIKLANEIMSKVKAEGKTEVSGEDMFRLYDTYGFPFDLTQDMAEEQGLTVDMAGFNKAMEHQREMSKAGKKAIDTWDLALIFKNAGEGQPTKFIGYDTLLTQGTPIAMAREGEIVEFANDGEEVAILFDETPFYATMGGQSADFGTITGKTGHIDVTNVTKMQDGRYVHEGVVSGQVHVTDTFELKVDADRRKKIASNHSATHLLHKALRTVLGDHVYQAGSLVEADRLRFDFAHFNAMTEEEIAKVEAMVNEAIRANYSIVTNEMPIEDAKKDGAMALFGEKYGSVVRVVTMGDFSKELCGGTHLTSTGEAGVFKIVSETAVSAGVRRIEAVTGEAVLTLLNEKETELKDVADILRCPVAGLSKKAQNLMDELKATQKALQAAEAKLAAGQSQSILEKVVELNGVKTLITKVDVRDMDAMRSMGDTLKEKIGSGIVVLAAEIEDKVNFIVSVSKDIAGKKAHAGNIIKEVAGICGGSGGGRPDMAQAGAKDASKLAEALNKAKDIIEGQMK